MPIGVGHRHPAEEGERLALVGAPLAHPGGERELLDDRGRRRFLQQHQVRRTGADHRGKCRLAAGAAAHDVVGEQPERTHGVSGVLRSV